VSKTKVYLLFWSNLAWESYDQLCDVFATLEAAKAAAPHPYQGIWFYHPATPDIPAQWHLSKSTKTGTLGSNVEWHIEEREVLDGSS